jgi:hypothetical protein
MNLADVTALKDELDRKRSEADRLTGVYDETKKQIAKDFGCKTLKEARVLLDELKEAEDKAKRKLDRALDEYKAKHK